MNSNQISQNKRDSIKVCIRFRPILVHEDTEYWSIDPNTGIISSSNKKEFTTPMSKILMDSTYSKQQFQFDKVYSKETNSQQIYKEMCRNITKNFINGINGSIFTYGQTTSGKTFTMLGTPQNPG
ncbi:MAG: hypothetical protein MJ252_12285 [archaeon]|nr:hypothetical protein [archaeon]